MRARFLFRWYDLWIGVFIDRPNRRVYIFPLPMLGICIEWAVSDPTEETTECVT